MDFALNDEQRALQHAVRDFAREVIAPEVDKALEHFDFPYGLIDQMGQMGLFGLPFDERWGGQGGDLFSLCLAIEEVGRIDQSVGITLEAAVGLGATPIALFGTDAQKERWLPDLCSGKALAAFGLTEPDGGSDIRGATKTRAVRDGDQWVINGSKAFITNVGTDRTSICTVVARTDDEELTSIIVPVDTPGFSVAPAYRKIGWHLSDTHEVSLVDVRVPLENTLGDVGNGLRQFLETLDDGRIAIAALATGMVQGCVDECLRYAAERTAFGSSLGSKQAIAMKIADMEVAAQASRLLWQKACWLRAQGKPYKREASAAKLYSSEAATNAAVQAVQVFGGAGFMLESRVGRFVQDAKVLEIGEGTSEVQRLLIARDLGLDISF